MRTYWSLEPEVSGELGVGTVIDTSTHPPRVEELQYRFSGWLGDDLVESFPCYVVTERLSKALVAARLTGFQLGSVDVQVSEEFTELHPDLTLPKFYWLRVDGLAGNADFGMSADHLLVVSERALGVLKEFTLEHCEFEAYGNGSS